MVSLIDVTKTIFDAAGVTPKQAELMPGNSLVPIMTGAADAKRRTGAFSGRERHSSSRYNTLSYPCRCIRTAKHLYIRNFTPERWPAGTPQKFASVKYDAENKIVESKLGPAHGGYHDIDDGPTLQWMIRNRDKADVNRLFVAATALRPAEELYDIVADPACLNNLALDPKSDDVRTEIAQQLDDYLKSTGDLRSTSPEEAHIWETYPRYSPVRWFETPEWAKNGDATPQLKWLDDRRPR